MDVDARALLVSSCPEGADPTAMLDRAPPDSVIRGSMAPPSMVPPATKRRPPSARRAKRLLRVAERDRAKGRVVHAMLAAARASMSRDDAIAHTASRHVHEHVGALVDRLRRALAPPDAPAAQQDPLEIAFAGGESGEWHGLVHLLAAEAVSRPHLFTNPESRFLHDLERACREGEEEDCAVDLVTWLLSRGRRPVVRPLPATRELRIARHVRAAAHGVWALRMPTVPRRALARLLRQASERAEGNVRAALRPEILRVLDAVGLLPRSAPERVARGKLVDELLDQAVAHNFVHLAHLRDAVSRNQLKMSDLSRAGELTSGDPLLRADALLAESLDGVYRRGEIYLRALQKFSSVAFGTRPGRFATLYVLLPFGGAFVVLEGTGHMVTAVTRALDLGEVHLLSAKSFVLTALALFGLIHSAFLRTMTVRMLRTIASVLALVFLRAPRWILTRPPIRRFLRSRPVRVFTRRVLFPALLTALVVAVTPLARASLLVSVPATLGIFAVTSALFALRAALVVEDILLDWLGPTWRTLSGQIVPGLVRMIAGLFRFLLDSLAQLFNRVDEKLRSRAGQSALTVGAKAALGAVWFVVAYVSRLYTTLLIEPEINPLKHFPVVTVAHKLLLPVSPELLTIVNHALSPLGTVVGGTIAATTVFLLPSIFGFLVWELKENRNLYQASRKKTLERTRVGFHGETMSQLLVSGFHSGTLPKLYDRLRREALREESLAVGSTEGKLLDGDRPEGALGRFREGTQAVEEALTRFTQRELVALLGDAARWRHGPIEVAGIQLGSNRIRVRLACPSLGDAPCEIGFDEQSGLLVASVVNSGFLAKLAEGDDARVLFENALAGFYQLSGVDIVREQIEAALGPTQYDISDEGLIVWPDAGYATEIVYRLDERPPLAGTRIEPRVRGMPLDVPPPVLDEHVILYRHQAIPWSAWVEAWEAASREDGPVPRLTAGASLLP